MQLTEAQKTYLEGIRRNCPNCGGLGFKTLKQAQVLDIGQAEQCTCSKRIAQLYGYMTANIPPKFIDMSLKDFTNELPRRYVNYIGQFDWWMTKSVGLYLFGSNGTGKSFLLAELVKKALDSGRTAYFTTLEQLLTKIYKALNDPELEDEIVEITNVDFLAIDEIEKIYKTDKENSFAGIAFDNLFRTRSNNEKTISVTSNKEIHELKGIHGQHLVSLFKENLVPVLVAGSDFREEIAKHLGEELDKER